MQKTGTVLTAASVAAGVLIALLRVIHTNKYMTGGLPQEGFLTSLLNYAAIAAIIVAVIIAYVIGKKKAAHKEIIKSMATAHSGLFLISQILGAALICVHVFLAYPTEAVFLRNQDRITLVLAVSGAVCHIIVSLLIYTGKTKKFTGFLGLPAALYFSLQLGEIFYVNMANPVLLEYTYECIALGMCAPYIVAMAGNAAGRDQVFNIVVTCVLALTCAPASLTGPQLLSEHLLLYFAVMLITLPALPIFMPNLIKRVKQPKEKKKDKKKE